MVLFQQFQNIQQVDIKNVSNSSSGAIIFKLHFWEHVEKLKHLHVQIAIKNERRGNEKARI